jgi:hypothetical protein
MKLRKIGLPHSLHFTRPMSEVDVRGRTPNNLISRAVSHEVGGDGRGELCRDESVSHDTNGSSGLEGFSLKVIVTVTSLLYSIHLHRNQIKYSGLREFIPYSANAALRSSIIRVVRVLSYTTFEQENLGTELVQTFMEPGPVNG